MMTVMAFVELTSTRWEVNVNMMEGFSLVIEIVVMSASWRFARAISALPRVL
jgi:hypothetical protein